VVEVESRDSGDLFLLIQGGLEGASANFETFFLASLLTIRFFERRKFTARMIALRLCK
jgi:hypothetical protein